MQVEDLVAGCVYVTRGGLVTMESRDGVREELPWGYDRVKYVRTTEEHIIVETPWGSLCELPIDYDLAETTETSIRKAYPLRGVHISRKVIPFSQALALGIAEELSEEQLKKLRKDANDTTIPDRQSGTSRDDLTSRIIEFYLEPKTMSEGAKHFGVQFQKIRYTLNNIKKKGHGGVRYALEEHTAGKQKTMQLTKV